MSGHRFIADENIEWPIVRELRKCGFDVFSVAESHAGISDEQVLEYARSQNRIVLTQDKDFGELVYRLQFKCPGILLLRLPMAPWHEHWKRLHDVIDAYHGNLIGSFTIVDQDKVRFRPIEI